MAQLQIRLSELIRRNNQASQRSKQALAVKHEATRVFDDIIINRMISPELYNIRLALEKIEYTIDGNQKGNRKRGHNEYAHGSAKTFKGKMADTLMRRLGVSVTKIPKDFSLLHCEDNKSEEENPEIYDEKEFKDLENQKITIDDKFTEKDDPIYELDEDTSDDQNYQKEINKDPNKDVDSPNDNKYGDNQGEFMETPNMSNLAASIAQVNLSQVYPGQTKHFEHPSINRTYDEVVPLSEKFINNSDRYLKRYGLTLQSPYEVMDPNKEDEIALLITADQQNNGSGKNVGIYVKDVHILNRYAENSVNINHAGTKSFKSPDKTSSTEGGETATWAQGQG